MSNENSVASYIRSITRASSFRDQHTRLRRVILGDDEEITDEHRHLGHHHTQADEGHEIGHGTAANEQSPLLNRRESQNGGEGNETTSLEPLQSRVTGSSQDRVQELARQRDETRAQMKDDEREPLLITRVRRDDGTVAEVIVGQSTLPQTIFNSSNTLIGVGILSLPLGIKYAGWVIGITGLLLSAVVSKYSAGLLAKCIDVDSSLANFADIAYVAFGEKGRVTTSLLITLELMVACVGLVVLFADTLQSLIPGLTQVQWKVLCGCVLAPLQFLPMRLLGFTSFVGIICNMVLLVVALAVGFMKKDAPGSLRVVAVTRAFPKNWRAVPLSFGLIMALWSGHSVFPQIYRDMRHPHKYATGLNLVFTFVTTVDFAMAIIGYLLYGDDLLDELTTNMIQTRGYAKAVKIAIMVMVATIPITKFPLHAAPIVSTLEVAVGVDYRAALLKPNRVNQSRFLTQLTKSTFRLLVALIAIVLAIAIPSFETIAALLGGFFGFLICVIMPVGFHLKIFRGQIPSRQVALDWVYIVISAILAVVGTTWEFLPRSWIGT